MDESSRIDLRALDPDADPGASDRFVDGVMARVGSMPVPRSMPADPLIGIWSLLRSPAIAAGIVAAIALGAVSVRMRQANDRPQTLAQAVGVPPEFLMAAQSPPMGSGR